MENIPTVLKCGDQILCDNEAKKCFFSSKDNGSKMVELKGIKKLVSDVSMSVHGMDLLDMKEAFCLGNVKVSCSLLKKDTISCTHEILSKVSKPKKR